MKECAIIVIILDLQNSMRAVALSEFDGLSLKLPPCMLISKGPVYKIYNTLDVMQVIDVIRMCADGKSRCRTWQMLKNGEPWKVINVLEQQTSTEDVYFEEKAT